MRLLAAVLLANGVYASESIASDQDTCFKKVIATLSDAINNGKNNVSPKSSMIADAFATEKYKDSNYHWLLVGIAINESDLNPNARNISRTKRGFTAVDTGLMGVRCLFRGSPGAERVCTNGYVRGLTLTQLAVPATNVAVAVRMLTDLRDKPTRIIRNGRRVVCGHKSHPYYAHYNWGNRVFTTGPASAYPYRVAGFAQLLATLAGEPAPSELGRVRSITYKSKRYRDFAKLFKPYKGMCAPPVLTAN